jgi:phosphoribosylformimino-5-aminoimidazole carboxamide ribotide isomerase
VILGTRALRDPTWCEQMARTFPGRIVLGVDARQGRVALEGWIETGEVTAVEVARRSAGWPLAALIYTDIGRDGMLAGPDIEGTRALAAAVPFPVFASGGVTTVDDVRRVKQAGLAGCIVGRALYEGQLDLALALRIAANNQTVAGAPG